MDKNAICATCKFIEIKSHKKGSDPSKVGYCYGNPPVLPGNFRVQVNLRDRACHVYQPKNEAI